MADDDLEVRVLQALAEGDRTLVDLAATLAAAPPDVRLRLDSAIQRGLVSRKELDDGTHFSLTTNGSGRFTSTHGSFTLVLGTGISPDFPDVSDLIAGSWGVTRAAQRAEEQLREEQLLLTSEERDDAVATLSDSYARGQIPIEELNRRTEIVLGAETRGGLRSAFEGLAPPPASDVSVSSAKRGRRVAFGLVALAMSPFLVLGVLMMVAGRDVSERLLGSILTVVLLPALFAIGRWANRRGRDLEEGSPDR